MLAVAPGLSPAKLLLGIGAGGGYVHALFVFQDPSRPDDMYDDRIGASFRLPVRDDG